MNKKCTQIALGGVFSSLCLLLMFMTGLFPFASYVLPMLAGATLVAVVVENGGRTAFLVYVCVSVLSVFVVPDPDAKIVFIAFFGYYPIVKQRLERLRSRAVEFAAKLALFNAAVVGGYALSITVLGMRELMSGFEEFGQYTLLFLLAAGNLLFLLYDVVLTKYISIYIHWFKPRFLRR